MVEGIGVSAADRALLEAVVAAPSSPQKHVWRARIILLSADGVGTIEVARRAGVAKPTVWRWQQWFLSEGAHGLLREKSRPPGIAPLPGETVARVVALTGEPPPGEATHWRVRAMARAVGISRASVQRIWQAHGLQPHRLKTFKLSKDGAPPASGVHPLPQRHRGHGAGRQGRPHDPRQLCNPQASQGPGLARPPHPRFVFHFTPTSCSWLNAVETFFAKLTRRRLKRGVFRSIVELQGAINHFIEAHNHESKPFVWTADPSRILDSVRRGHQTLETIH